MKFTAISHPNIALIKYWGKADEKLNIPLNNNISITLDKLTTTTTVEFSEKYPKDSLILNKKETANLERVERVLNEIRKMAGIKDKAKIVSENNFPTGAGLASSSSGFSALALAASKAAGLNLDKKELSILARLGSGSACRSIYGGFVEWLAGKKSEDSYAIQIAKPDYWDLKILVTIIKEDEKEVGSTKGHSLAKENPFLETRLKILDKYLKDVRNGIKEKDFTKVGKAAEFDCISMHATMMTSIPMLLYWTTGTIRVINAVKKMREEGLECYFTIDAGPNVKVLCLPENAKKIESKLREVKGVKNVIENRPGEDARISEDHLF
jgi:diphosphomevalonate decarboxylase